MFLEYANEYRELAQQCLAFAGAAWNAGAKAEWLELARKWQRVAEEAEKLAVKQAQQAARKSKMRH
jgi:hypothetical protein